MLNTISNLILPIIVIGIIIHGVYKKVNVYDTFVEGTKESFDMVITMFPFILAMILGINLFLSSNFLSIFINFLKPVLDFLKVPIDILPISIIRPISGSASLAMLNNILEVNGPDSFIGRLASVIQGSTDTTLYVITLYFGCIGIKKIRYALWVGLIADLIGIIASIIIVGLIFNG